MLTSLLHRMEGAKGHRMKELQQQDLRMLALRIMGGAIGRDGVVDGI